LPWTPPTLNPPLIAGTVYDYFDNIRQQFMSKFFFKCCFIHLIRFRVDNHRLPTSGVASSKMWGGKNFGGAKMFDFKRITLFCLERHLSKHKMTICFNNLGAAWPIWPPLATPMLPTSFHESQYDRWSSRMPTNMSIYSKHISCILRLVNRCLLLRVDQAKELVVM